jgi:hypothetical protein
MTASIRRAIVALAMLIAWPAGAAGQTPVRDVRREPTGNAVISGVVVTDEATPRPLRRATVQLAGDALMTGRQVITGSDGRFEFKNLPAGQFTLQALKSNYMRTSFGAKRPGGSGSSIVLAENEKVSDVSIKLPQYAVISGTIYDQNGEPAQGISVEVMAYTMRTGRRTLSSVYGRPQTTDDRGMYRAGGLVPGDYYVAAGPSPDNGSNTVRVLAPGDVDRAIQQTNAAPAAPAPPQKSVAFAPVFYPGIADLAGASKVTVGLGEDRSGIDFALQLVPTSRIDGVVTGPDGRPVAGALVANTLVTQGFSLDLFRGVLGGVRTDRDGRFSYDGVPPGRYVLDTRTEVSGAALPLWAMAEIVVSGADQQVALSLQPGAQVSGKLVFDGTTLQKPADLSAWRISMLPATPDVRSLAAAAAVNPDLTFEVVGASPGQFRLSSNVPPAANGWVLKSAVVNGVDSLDVPFEVRAGQIVSGATLTYTDHPTELSGTLQTAAGVPTSNYFIIVFSADKTFWTPLSRRIVMARPASTGKYLVRNLPPGDYFVAAVTDVEFNAWYDSALLDAMIDASTRITIAEGAKKVLDLKIGG